MKIKFVTLLVLAYLVANRISAQLVITPGSQLTVTGSTQVSLVNTDLVNNGSLATGNSTFSFAGNASSTISGNQSIRFFELEINKTNNLLVKLQRPIDVTSRTHFTSGFLDLNGFTMDLGTTGHLDGELENTRVVGPNGGEVRFNVNLNSPNGSNPANLGMFITANQDLGNVTIRRGHQSQPGIAGLNRSILRYYDIAPTNNINLAGTVLRFHYFDGELNGIHEDSLEFFKSDNNGVNWSIIGFTSRDIVGNVVQRGGLGAFSRFTLSAGSDFPLPVTFLLFNARCETNKVIITWKTAQEQNSSHFDIQRSADGIQWAVIGSVAAAGTSNSEKKYSFNDNTPMPNGYYRIVQYDQDGRGALTSILRSSCDVTDVFAVVPNPFRDEMFVNITTDHESAATIRLYDSKGALVKMAQVNLLSGNNQVRLDGGVLAKGIYTIQAIWDDGVMKRAVKVIKE